MGLLGRLSVLCMLVLASACSEDEATEQRRRLLEVDERPRSAKRSSRPPLYDDQGRLRPSDERVAGLQLPRGLELMREVDKRRIYTSRVPAEKLRAYFGPRLTTGQVRSEGGGITYLAAVPRNAKGGVVKLDVRIGSNPSHPDQSLVDIRECPPAPAKPLTEAEIRMQLEQRQKHAD